MDTLLYWKLSAMMFMEYAVWGAWMPVLAARLLGPLKMSGKQTGWIYATLPLGAMISPLIAGQLADNYIDPRWILAVSHLLGALLLFGAARIQKFGPLFVVMLIYSLFYTATLPLVNSVMLTHVKDAEFQSKIFIWAPIAWALAGYVLSSWRMTRKTEGDGSDCLVFAAILSLAMSAICVVQPATAPQGGSMLEALSLLGQPNFLIFILVSLVVAGLMQFYFLGTAQLMQDRGVPNKAVPASMAIAQAAQALATWYLLGLLYGQIAGPKWTLVIGAACWLVLYIVYVASQSRALLVICQALHGLAYVFFMIGGQLFTNAVAGPEIISSAQALIFLVTTGIGLFLGTQLAGFVMDRNSTEGKFDWKKVYTVPLLLMLAGMIALAVGVSDPKPATAEPQDKATVDAPAAMQEEGEPSADTAEQAETAEAGSAADSEEAEGQAADE